MELAVRGGSHSVPGFGTGDDALVADLSGLSSVTVDPSRRTATAGDGVTWGGFNEATAAHGLATTGGVISTTGVGGLTLGGGIGYLARAHRLSCDNLISAQVVTADGEIVTASDLQHPDLFWALRGGSGNFGVVTEFTFQLHPVAEIYGGPMFFELSDGPAVLGCFNEYIRTAPREYGGFPAFQIAPPLPFVPESRVGEPLVAVVSCWTGSPHDGEKVLQGFRDVANPVAEHVGLMPYPALNSSFDALVPPGLQHYWKAAFVRDVTAEAIRTHLEHGSRVPVVNSTAHLYPINGACHDVAAGETAFGHRDANYAVVIAGMWPDPADNEANTKWVGTTTRRSRRTHWGASRSTSPPPTTSRRWQPTTGSTIPGCSRSSAATTRATCSTSTRTSGPDGTSLMARPSPHVPSPHVPARHVPSRRGIAAKGA